MKIGILGSGMVATTLGTGFIKHGYEVMLGTRSPEKLADWATESGGLVGSFTDAAAYGEVVVLAVKGAFAEEVVGSLGSGLDGKTVIDTTNPISNVPPEKGILKFFTSLEDSLMERLQSKAPLANFVKSFNSVGSAYMVDPDFESRPTMCICGNNEEAKKVVAQILERFGHDVEDMGSVEAARAIEPLCMLWCIPGFIRNQWNHAFKLLKK